MTYRSDLSNPFDYNVFGIITGTAGSVFPSIEAQLVRLEAWSTNIGSFFIGRQSGSSYTTWELDAGVDTGWFGILFSCNFPFPVCLSGFRSWNILYSG